MYLNIYELNFLLKVVKELSLIMNGILIVSLHIGSESINAQILYTRMV